MSTSFNEMTGVEIEMNPVEKPEKRQDIWFLKDSPEKSSHLGFSLSQFTNSLFKYDRLPADKNVPSNGNSVRSNKYEWADGIRGIAAFIVLIHHIQCAFFGESANSHVRYRFRSMYTFSYVSCSLAPFIFCLSSF